MWVGQGGPILALSHPHTYTAVLPPIVGRGDRGGVVSGGTPYGCPWEPAPDVWENPTWLYPCIQLINNVVLGNIQ